MGSFSIDKGNGNDNAKNENLIGRMKKKKRDARGTQLFIFLYTEFCGARTSLVVAYFADIKPWQQDVIIAKWPKLHKC